MLVTTPKNCDVSVKKAIQQLARKLGGQSSPTFENLTLTDLVASRLIATDSGKTFESVSDLTNWIKGTENQVVVSVLAGGKVTLSTPQDTHVDAHPEFAGITIKDDADDIIFYVDNDEMYFTAVTDIPIATGHGMPWLFWFTYTV